MQKVNWTKQAALAATLLVLGSVAYWLEYKHKPEKESKDEQSKKIFAVKDKAVTSFTIHDGAGHVFAARCSDTTGKLCKAGDNSKWELISPIKLKADDANANALLSSLNNLSTGETISLKEETPEKRASLLKEYGLDATARSQSGTKRIEVTTPNETTTLYLGLNHPIGDSIFGVIAKGAAGVNPVVNEDKVYLVPTYFKTNFDHDLTYWRDKKLLTLSAHEIGSFDLKAPRAQVHGARKDGQWTLAAPTAAAFIGDIENIDNLLTAATFLTAKNFASDNKGDAKGKAALKGTRPVVTLTMQPEKGDKAEVPAPITLTLYQKGGAIPKPSQAGKSAALDGKIYATVSNLDPLYELEPNALDRFDKQLKDLRNSKLISSMERFTAKKLEFSGKPLGATPLVLIDKDGNWSIEGHPAVVANAKVQEVLEKVSGNRIQEFLNTANAPKGESDGLTLKITDDKGVLKRQLVLWKSGPAKDEKLFARDLANKEKEIYRVDPAIIGALPWSRDHFEQKATPSPGAGGPGVPVPPPHGSDDGHGHGALPGAPPEPGKALIPQPAKK